MGTAKVRGDNDWMTIDVDRDWQLLIDGDWVDPAGGTYDIVDPSTTSVVGRAPEATRQQADDAAAAAKAALVGWKALSRDQRCEHIGRFYEIGGRFSARIES